MSNPTPSNYILTSDFMSIGEISSTTVSFTLPSGSSEGEWNYYFTVPEQAGAIDRVQITINGTTVVDCTPNITSGSDSLLLEVRRTSATQVRVQLVSYGVGARNTDTVSIRIDSFAPPTV